MMFDKTQLYVMELAGYKYPQFKWLKSWTDFGCALQSMDLQLDFFKEVANYGLCESEPQRIKDEVLEYFNQYIRPELDRQHKEMKPHLIQLGYGK